MRLRRRPCPFDNVAGRFVFESGGTRRPCGAEYKVGFKRNTMRDVFDSALAICGAGFLALMASCDSQLTAGIQGSGTTVAMAQGPTAGFGSALVHDVECDATPIQIPIDGEPGSEEQPQVWQIVSIQPMALTGLQAGAVVELSGYLDALGRVVVLRIGPKAAGGMLRVTGTVQPLHSTADTFRIDSLAVDCTAWARPLAST